MRKCMPAVLASERLLHSLLCSAPISHSNGLIASRVYSSDESSSRFPTNYSWKKGQAPMLFVEALFAAARGESVRLPTEIPPALEDKQLAMALVALAQFWSKAREPSARIPSKALAERLMSKAHQSGFWATAAPESVRMALWAISTIQLPSYPRHRHAAEKRVLELLATDTGPGPRRGAAQGGASGGPFSSTQRGDRGDRRRGQGGQRGAYDGSSGDIPDPYSSSPSSPFQQRDRAQPVWAQLPTIVRAFAQIGWEMEGCQTSPEVVSALAASLCQSARRGDALWRKEMGTRADWNITNSLWSIAKFGDKEGFRELSGALQPYLLGVLREKKVQPHHLPRLLWSHAYMGCPMPQGTLTLALALAQEHQNNWATLSSSSPSSSPTRGARATAPQSRSKAEERPVYGFGWGDTSLLAWSVAKLIPRGPDAMRGVLALIGPRIAADEALGGEGGSDRPPPPSPSPSGGRPRRPELGPPVPWDLGSILWALAECCKDLYPYRTTEAPVPVPVLEWAGREGRRLAPSMLPAQLRAMFVHLARLSSAGDDKMMEMVQHCAALPILETAAPRLRTLCHPRGPLAALMAPHEASWIIWALGELAVDPLAHGTLWEDLWGPVAARLAARYDTSGAGGAGSPTRPPPAALTVGSIQSLLSACYELVLPPGANEVSETTDQITTRILADLLTHLPPTEGEPAAPLPTAPPPSNAGSFRGSSQTPSSTPKDLSVKDAVVLLLQLCSMERVGLLPAGSQAAAGAATAVARLAAILSRDFSGPASTTGTGTEAEEMDLVMSDSGGIDSDAARRPGPSKDSSRTEPTNPGRRTPSPASNPSEEAPSSISPPLTPTADSHSPSSTDSKRASEAGPAFSSEDLGSIFFQAHLVAGPATRATLGAALDRGRRGQAPWTGLLRRLQAGEVNYRMRRNRVSWMSRSLLAELQQNPSLAGFLASRGLEPVLDLATEDGLLKVDIGLRRMEDSGGSPSDRQLRVTIEADGAQHFLAPTLRRRGRTVARDAMLSERGWRVISVDPADFAAWLIQEGSGKEGRGNSKEPAPPAWRARSMSHGPRTPEAKERAVGRLLESLRETLGGLGLGEHASEEA